jgi:hypothetical protein
MSRMSLVMAVALAVVGRGGAREEVHQLSREEVRGVCVEDMAGTIECCVAGCSAGPPSHALDKAVRP